MGDSIDTIRQTSDTLPLPSIAKTYKLPEGVLFWPDESFGIGGFIARGTIDGQLAVVALDGSNDEETAKPSSDVQQYLEATVFGDTDFMRSAYYNRIARHQSMTMPNVFKMTKEDQEQLEQSGLSMVSAAGSLEGLEKREGSAAGLTLSKGSELQEISDIEARAEEVGWYSQVTVHFPGDKQGSHEECIILTDAAGNQILMPYQEETTEALERLFGYKRADEQLFDVDTILSNLPEDP